MLKPYRQVEETDEFMVYEFKTIYLYAMYCFLDLMLAGWIAKSQLLGIFGVVLTALYFLIVSTQYMGLSSRIKRAAKESSVEMAGNKWSFSNPLKVKIKKEFI